MTFTNRQGASMLWPRIDPSTALFMGVALVFFIVSGFVSYANIGMAQVGLQKVLHSHDVIVALDDLLLAILDTETGQRGYLLTADEKYLEPYLKGALEIEPRVRALTSLTADDHNQQARLVSLSRRITAKLSELKETVDLRREGRIDSALARVKSGLGKVEMDAIRAQIGEMEQEETRFRAASLADMESASSRAWLGGVLSGLLVIALTGAVGVLVSRAAREREKQDWLNAGHIGLAAAMLGDKSVKELGDDILNFLTDFLGASAGALFKGEDGRFYRAAQSGVPADAALPETFSAKEGLLGQVAAKGRVMILSNVPEGYLTIGSALGRGKPRHLAIAPLSADGVVNAVLELGFFTPVGERVPEFLGQIEGVAGVTLRSARYRARLHETLDETQRLAEELQVQSEELRVSNEELEEQGNALKDSQVRLEQQQVELEQTNTQLEEQAQQLEAQRDNLARSAAALSVKARELEQASRYKSDFLANMSHELRTPLNSLLILSKLLADNAKGNLTAEQVNYARTIQSSGDDLLVLINDILDLSKIEAGQLEIRPEIVSVKRLADDLRRTFQPVADQRKLRFDMVVADDCPDAITTDRLRLEQVLKNLLSNAFKFTESGTVQLAVSRAGDSRIALAVSDTGIGIPEEQQQTVFLAFRQADGTLSRKYGGTGLGLSISRELTRLLGGVIELRSRPGEGSVFTVTLPLASESAHVEAAPVKSPAIEAAAPAPASRSAAPAPSSAVVDDRDSLSERNRNLLIIEDDQSFAAIMRDLAHEMDFRCLIAGTAEEAMDLARRYKPSAIVLDVGLPDQSGLTVLDRLKREADTRHIPVHVVSASEHAQTALSLGAVGYLVKPVKREELAKVFETLEAQLTRTMRRILIVEDDPRQREAIGELLGAAGVETVGAGTAAECLQRLQEQSFDCMVLDLWLPDASGFSLLETLSQKGDYAFPPVIVYTGQDLSIADEQRLRRYSNSIIIKGAKSPERLLDEVSLFLHQVVSELPTEQQRMIQQARSRDSVLEGRRILVVEDDVRNVFSLTNILEPQGVVVEIARNGEEAIAALEASAGKIGEAVDLVLMDVMMPVMDGLEATRRLRSEARWSKLPIIMLTAKAMPDDQERCLEAGANDYMSKPLDVEKLLSLVRVWMPR